MSVITTVAGWLGHGLLFIGGVVLWVNLVADLLRFRDLNGLPTALSDAWLRLLKTGLLLLIVLLIALRFDSAAPLWALAWSIGVRSLAWVGYRLALSAGWRAAVDDRATSAGDTG